ncbi:hypothetical protein BpHYR1_014933 [Brachionus plicatilis]|uniref:Apple domain-containing protein n=1 Tax=Brachionus plicatilis TaxID=10195 RepID=A0A3M7SBV6_BRAPC|nr:hypothetical protein BpHYR1_014933 [Brachionus plicatilis]
MNYFGFLFLINLVVLCAKTENYTIRLQKQKRDACNDQAISIVSQSVLSIVESISKGGNLLGLGSNFVGLLSSVYGFNSPTTCELNQKLNLILWKLDEITKEIKNTVECSNIKQDFRNNILKKSTHLISLFIQHHKTPFKEESKKNIIETCLDKTEGISKLLSSFNIILQDDLVIDEFKSCYEYKKNGIDKWAQNIRKFTLVFVSLVRGCEDAYGYETDFDPDAFIQDIEKRINFHMEFTLIESFVNDQGPNGIYQSILSVLKKNTDPYSNLNELEDSYGFFEWGVIRYSDEMHGSYRRSTDYKYNTIPYLYKNGEIRWSESEYRSIIQIIKYKPVFYGELRFKNKDELKKSAVVYWSFKYGLDGAHSFENFCAHPKQLSYSSRKFGILKFVCLQSWNDLTDLNCMYSIDSKTSLHLRHTYYCSTFSTNNFLKEKPVMSSLSNFAINFPAKSQKNQILMTNSLNLDTRLYGHYKEINETSARKCRNACLNDNQCIASTFTKLDWTYPCFLYKNGYRKGDDKDWISYIKN